jgi:acetoacetyl-CoA synthetase
MVSFDKTTNTPPLWTPDHDAQTSSQIGSFIEAVRGLGFPSVDGPGELYRWSIAHPAQFWELVWDRCGVQGRRIAGATLKNGSKMPGAEWFPGATLNFAANLLRFNDERTACIFWGENQVRRTVTYRELNQLTARIAVFLRKAGVGRGDRVAGVVANTPETIAAMLAAASLGAIWSSCSPDFGVSGIVDRFGQIEPRILFTCDGYFHKDRRFDVLEKAFAVAAAIPSIQRIVVLPYIDPAAPLADLPANGIALGALTEEAPLAFAELPFDHPLYVMFSSGTTGKPKCMVHGAGGTLIEHLKELRLHTGLTRDDVFFYQTTCGWMMWNWLVSGLAVGATLALFDGAPFARDGRIVFDLVEQERVTVFGTNAKFLAAVEKEGLKPRETHDLSRVRAILSTGSPLLPESFDYVYRDVAPHACLSSIAGGTDIIGCFVLGSPIQPVYRGEIQTRSLGLKVEVFDEAGRSIVGEKGELVCTAPFPSMPVGFWNDPDGARYRTAYFERFPGIWHHGDYVELTPRGGMVMFGRSDTVLNPGGIRIGTAEIYNQIEKLPEIAESLVIGQEWENDVRVVLFVRLQPGVVLDAGLSEKIRMTIRSNTTAFHVPKKIIAVSDIPRTRSGKIVELAVREVVHGRPVKNIEALANPEALDLFRALPEIKTS